MSQFSIIYLIILLIPGSVLVALSVVIFFILQVWFVLLPASSPFFMSGEIVSCYSFSECICSNFRFCYH